MESPPEGPYRDMRARAERVLAGTQTGRYTKRAMARDIVALLDDFDHNRDLLRRNLLMLHEYAEAKIQAGEQPAGVLEWTFDLATGFVQGRVGMVVPPDLIPAEELEAAIQRGRDLVAEHGWLP